MSTPEGQTVTRQYTIDPSISSAMVDDFSASLEKWEESGVGAGDWVVERVTNRGFLGEASYHLQTALTTATNDTANMKRHVGIPSQGDLLKTDVVFMTREDVSKINISFGMVYYKQRGLANSAIMFEIKWLGATGVWAYYDSAGVYQTLSGLPSLNTSSTKDYWHRLRMVVRPHAGKFASAEVDDAKQEITAGGNLSPAGGKNMITFWVEITTLEAVQKEMWVGFYQLGVEE